MPVTEHHITRYQRWLHEHARPVLRQLRRAVALVGRATWRPSGARSGTTSTSQSPTPHDCVLRAPVMPGARVVSRRAAQLRAAPVPSCRGQPRRRPPGHRLQRRGAAGARRAARAELARAAAPGGCLCRGLQGAGRAARRPRLRASCPTCPRPSSSSWPAPAWARSGRCARPTWARWRCSTVSARSSPSCWWPATATATAASRTTGARCWPQAAGRAAQRAPRGAVAQPRPRHADAGRPGAPGARPGRAAGRRCALRAAVAALRPPAVGGVFQRHHRAAQADRARPRRRHARSAEAGHAAQRRRPQRAARRPLPLVLAAPAGSCGTARSARCSAAPRSASSTAARPGRTARPTGARCGASPALARCSFFGAGAAFYASCLKAGVEPQAVADLSALRAVGSTGSPLSEDCYRWVWDQLPKVDGKDIWLTPICRRHRFRRRLHRRAARRCRWWPARCSAAAWAPRSRPGPSPMHRASAGR